MTDRYDLNDTGATCPMVKRPDGEYVSYNDYTSLLAERDAAQLLADRLAPLEGDLLDDEVSRQYHGHVAPALAHLNSALKSTNGGDAR